MTRNIGVNKFIAQWLFWVFLFFCCILLPVSGMMDENKADEKNGGENQNQLVVLPILYYTPETKLAGGAGGIYYLRTLKDQLRNRPSTFFIDLVYTQRKQALFEITPDLYLKNGRIHLVGYIGLKKYVEKFYGIGSHTTNNMEEDYSFWNVMLKCSLRNRVNPSFYAGVQFDFEHSKIIEVKPGGLLDSQDVVGKEGGTISGLGIVLVQDNRNNIFFPTRGTLFQVQASLYSQAFGSGYNFQKVNFDFRQYISVFSKHVLAFQQNVNLTSGDVPFQWMSILGGPSAMRGYILGRFRDKHSILLQMEYRMPLIWRLCAAGFVACGDVADKMKRFKIEKFKVTGGLGIRFQVNRKSGTNVRLDFGFARGSFGVYAMINEAF